MDILIIETATYRLNLANGCLTLTEKTRDGRTFQAVIGDVYAAVGDGGTKLNVTFGTSGTGTSNRITLDVPQYFVDKARELPRLLVELATTKVRVPEPVPPEVAPAAAGVPAPAPDDGSPEPSELDEPEAEPHVEPATAAGPAPAIRASMTPKVQVAPSSVSPTARPPAAAPVAHEPAHMPPKPGFTGAPTLDLAFPADDDNWIVFEPLPATLRLITDP